jgi:sugar lactone lactonase YvrE
MWNGITADRSGKTLYVYDLGSNRVVAFNRDENGDVTE